MNIQINTSGESYLAMRFFTNLLIRIPADFKDRTDFNFFIFLYNTNLI